ncbi:MAG: hydantoinase/oxoprolinase family protein [Pirellulales bacterium]
MNWLGIDIGGAHLKLATVDGRSLAAPFPMWRAPEQLADHVARLIAQLDPGRDQGLAVTMTGELADCFVDKSAGVRHISESAQLAASGRPVRIYAVGGHWLGVDRAIREPIRVAASNWHALAQYSLRSVEQWPAWLIDIGSTTTDIIPLNQQGPAARGHTDWTRLLASELIYTGVERTPVFAVLQRPIVATGFGADIARGSAVGEESGQSTEGPIRVGLAAELFATMQDVYVALGDLAEAPDNRNTADNRPLTRMHSLQRLRRLLCADQTEVADSIVWEIARQAADRQTQLVADGMTELSRRVCVPHQIVFGGHGEFLARRALTRLGWQCELRRLGDRLPPQLMRAATAYAVACLATEQLADHPRTD